MIFHLQGVWVEDRLGGRSCVDSLSGGPSAIHAREDSGTEVQEVTRKVFAKGWMWELGEKTIQNDP